MPLTGRKRSSPAAAALSRRAHRRHRHLLLPLLGLLARSPADRSRRCRRAAPGGRLRSATPRPGRLATARGCQNRQRHCIKRKRGRDFLTSPPTARREKNQGRRRPTHTAPLTARRDDAATAARRRRVASRHRLRTNRLPTLTLPHSRTRYCHASSQQPPRRLAMALRCRHEEDL